MKNDQFGRLINYSGESLDALRNYAVAHEGNLVFGHITNSDGEFYYIYANSTEMKIPTKKQFDLLYEYVGKIPAEYTSTNIVDFIKEYVKVTLVSADNSITLTSTGSTLTFDYTGVATADDWAEIGNE